MSYQKKLEFYLNHLDIHKIEKYINFGYLHESHLKNNNSNKNHIIIKKRGSLQNE